MYLKSLSIKGWRNYKEMEIGFPPGVNIFFGNNGQGKTNLLEAIYFLASGNSPRTVKIEELINWDSKYFFLRGTFARGGTKSIVEMGGARDGRRVNKMDGVSLRRLADISGLFNAVFFMPQDLYLVKGGPARRRSFLDTEISQISKRYGHVLGNYKKYLQERNALLKSGIADSVLLQVLTEKLADLTGPITLQRDEYLGKLSVLTRLKHRKLSGNDDKIQLKYHWSVKPGLSRQKVLERFAETRLLEKRYKSTLVGPHRDDFSFSVNGIDLRTYGSQGQQRTAVLSLKLAEVELIQGETGEYPILILDDVFSELDGKRKTMLLEYLSGKAQTFISTTEPFSTKAAVTRHLVEAGSIKEGI